MLIDLLNPVKRSFPSPPPFPQRGEGKGEGDKMLETNLLEVRIEKKNS